MGGLQGGSGWCARCDAVLDAATCAALLAAVDDAIGAFRARPEHPDFSRHSSSLRLRALGPGALGSPLSLARRVLRGPVRAAIDTRLSAPWRLLADQCWARRQYAPHRYPPDHHPHAWHQDGALHLDFGAPPLRLLEMVTCWIALTPCGGRAPGLELVRSAQEQPWWPDALTVDAVAARVDPAARWRPVMNAGDALLFDGAIVHRTSVDAAMQADRTSIELRVVALRGALPARLAREALVDIDGP